MGKTKIYQTDFIQRKTGIYGNDNQDWEIKNTRIDYKKHDKYNIDIIRKPNEKIFGQRMYQERRINNPTCHN